MQSLLKFGVVICFSVISHCLGTYAFSQQESAPIESSEASIVEELELTLEQSELTIREHERSSSVSSQPAPKRLTSLPFNALPDSRQSSSPQTTAELVVQRYSNGNPHIKRHVILDREGNYVNHGEYEERSETGDLIVTGSYQNGQQNGPWIRFCTARDSELFAQEPYNKFKPPFQSSVEFVHGKLNGLWTISDKEGRTVSQIQFENGQRNGTAIFYHVTGTPLWQSQYRDGKLDGMFVEKDANGKTLREIRYYAGRRLEKKQEFYPNKKVKSEFELLGPSQTVETTDDWNRSTLATYALSGNAVKQGTHTVYFENGSPRSTAQYQNGELHGLLESWYPNGQKEVSGRYKNGLQEGQWDWWHPNGMRRSRVTYVEGKVEGEILAWSDTGLRVKASELVSVPIAQPKPPAETELASPPKRPGTPQQNSSTSSRRTAGR